MKHASILCFGDSLTAGYFANGSEFHPYAGTLQRILGRAALVEHCGLSGWTAKQMASTLDDQACTDVCGRTWKGLSAKLEERKYSHCILLAGTNDVSSDQAENIFRNVWKLAATASASGCVVYVMTIPEMAAEKARPSIKSTRSRVNKLLLQSQGTPLSQRSESALRVIDLAPLVPYASVRRTDRDRCWEPDGLHLRPAGYDIVAKVVAARLAIDRESQDGDFDDQLSSEVPPGVETVPLQPTANPAEKASSPASPTPSSRRKFEGPPASYESYVVQEKKTCVSTSSPGHGGTHKNNQQKPGEWQGPRVASTVRRHLVSSPNMAPLRQVVARPASGEVQVSARAPEPKGTCPQCGRTVFNTDERSKTLEGLYIHIACMNNVSVRASEHAVTHASQACPAGMQNLPLKQPPPRPVSAALEVTKASDSWRPMIRGETTHRVMQHRAIRTGNDSRAPGVRRSSGPAMAAPPRRVSGHGSPRSVRPVMRAGYRDFVPHSTTQGTAPWGMTSAAKLSLGPRVASERVLSERRVVRVKGVA